MPLNIPKQEIGLLISTLSTVHNANKIIVLDKGDIVDTGNHNELINKEGLYKQLHNMQFKT